MNAWDEQDPTLSEISKSGQINTKGSISSSRINITKNEIESAKIVDSTETIYDLKNTRMDGPTFQALRNYFDEWDEQDPTLFKISQRDVKRDNILKVIE